MTAATSTIPIWDLKSVPLHSPNRRYACELPEAPTTFGLSFDFRCYSCWLAGKALALHGDMTERFVGSAGPFTIGQMVEAYAHLHDPTYQYAEHMGLSDLASTSSEGRNGAAPHQRVGLGPDGVNGGAGTSTAPSPSLSAGDTADNSTHPCASGDLDPTTRTTTTTVSPRSAKNVGPTVADQGSVA